MDDTQGLPWSVSVQVIDLPPEGRHYELKADAPERERVAEACGLRSVEALSAVFDLVSGRGGRIALTGRVQARIEQLSVVSLEPVEAVVDEPIRLTLVPGIKGSADDEEVTLGEEEEPLLGSTVDLGGLAVEFFALGINPYPRREGEEFTPLVAESEPSEHPFAALAGLKRPTEGGETNED